MDHQLISSVFETKFRLNLGEAAAPRAILTGHETIVTMICISAEHGIVISASQGKRSM